MCRSIFCFSVYFCLSFFIETMEKDLDSVLDRKVHISQPSKMDISVRDTEGKKFLSSIGNLFTHRMCIVNYSGKYSSKIRFFLYVVFKKMQSATTYYRTTFRKSEKEIDYVSFFFFFPESCIERNVSLTVSFL